MWVWQAGRTVVYNSIDVVARGLVARGVPGDAPEQPLRHTTMEHAVVDLFLLGLCKRVYGSGTFVGTSTPYSNK